MPEEVAFFGRTSIYGLAIAVVYWFVSYDVTGTVLLAGFGLATGIGFLILWRRRGGDGGRTGEDGAAPDGDRPFTDEAGPVPLASFAPLELGIGTALVGLGLVFGIWFVLVAIIPVVAGALAWIREARREQDLVLEARPRR